MKIRMLETISIPSMTYFENNIYSGRECNFETLYNLFIKAGYAEEVREITNHYVQHNAHGKGYLHFPVCNTCKYACYSNEEPCKVCKLRHIQTELNSKIIDLIKSLLKNAT